MEMVAKSLLILLCKYSDGIIRNPVTSQIFLVGNQIFFPVTHLGQLHDGGQQGLAQLLDPDNLVHAVKVGDDVQPHLEKTIVKLREREGQGVDPGRSLKGHLWMVDGGWWYTFP